GSEWLRPAAPSRRLAPCLPGPAQHRVRYNKPRPRQLHDAGRAAVSTGDKVPHSAARPRANVGRGGGPAPPGLPAWRAPTARPTPIGPLAAVAPARPAATPQTDRYRAG